MTRLGRPTSNSTSKEGLLLVSHPNVEGLQPVPGATREIRTIESQLSSFEYSCVHLACHAAQDTSDPLSSGLFLHDGRLHISTLIESDLRSAELAFLSACQTSAGDEQLSEEAVHLAAGMLAAGYRGVVATMWAIQDQHAPDVSRDYYSELFHISEEGGDGKIDVSRAAYALHAAIGRLQEKLGDSEDALVCWVPYVHFGL